MIAAAAMSFSSVSVIANALRLRSGESDVRMECLHFERSDKLPIPTTRCRHHDPSTEDRRKFLKAGAIAAAAGVAGNAFAQEGKGDFALPRRPRCSATARRPFRRASESMPIRMSQAEIDGFSRFKPSRGNDPESPITISAK